MSQKPLEHQTTSNASAIAAYEVMNDVNKRIVQGANIHDTNNAGDNYLHLVLQHLAKQSDIANFRDQVVEVIQLLVEHQIDMHAKNKNGKSPAYYAVQSQHIPSIKIFIERDLALLFELDADGNSLFHLFDGDPLVFDLSDPDNRKFLKTTNRQGIYPIHSVAARGAWAALAGHMAIEQSYLEMTDTEGNLPLHHAAMHLGTTHHCEPNAYVWDLLIPNSASSNVNTANSHGETALICAAKAGNAQFMSALLRSIHKKDIQLGVQDHSGNSALHYAMQQSNVAIVKILITAGADSYLKNPLTQATALNLSIAKKNLAMCVLFNPFQRLQPSLDQLQHHTSKIADTIWPNWRKLAKKLNAIDQKHMSCFDDPNTLMQKLQALLCALYVNQINQLNVYEIDYPACAVEGKDLLMQLICDVSQYFANEYSKKHNPRTHRTILSISTTAGVAISVLMAYLVVSYTSLAFDNFWKYFTFGIAGFLGFSGGAMVGVGILTYIEHSNFSPAEKAMKEVLCEIGVVADVFLEYQSESTTEESVTTEQVVQAYDATDSADCERVLLLSEEYDSNLEELLNVQYLTTIQPVNFNSFRDLVNHQWHHVAEGRGNDSNAYDNNTCR